MNSTEYLFNTLIIHLEKGIAGLMYLDVLYKTNVLNVRCTNPTGTP